MTRGVIVTDGGDLTPEQLDQLWSWFREKEKEMRNVLPDADDTDYSIETPFRECRDAAIYLSDKQLNDTEMNLLLCVSRLVDIAEEQQKEIGRLKRQRNRDHMVFD